MVNTLTFQSIQLEGIYHHGELWLKDSEIGQAIGYRNGAAGIKRLYQRHAEEFSHGMVRQLAQGPKQTLVFSLHACHVLGLLARTTQAAQFRRWVLRLKEDLEKAVPLAEPDTELKNYADQQPTVFNGASSGCGPENLPKQAAIFKRTSLADLPEPLITPSQQRVLAGLVKDRVDLLPKHLRRKGRCEAWRRFNGHFKVKNYRELPAELFERAEGYLMNLHLRSAIPDLPMVDPQLEKLYEDIIAKQGEMLVWLRDVDRRFEQITGPLYQKVCSSLPFSQRSMDMGLNSLHMTRVLGKRNLKDAMEQLVYAALFARYFQRCV